MVATVANHHDMIINVTVADLADLIRIYRFSTAVGTCEVRERTKVVSFGFLIDKTDDQDREWAGRGPSFPVPEREDT